MARNLTGSSLDKMEFSPDVTYISLAPSRWWVLQRVVWCPQIHQRAQCSFKDPEKCSSALWWFVGSLPPSLLLHIPQIQYFLWNASPLRKLPWEGGNVCLSLGTSGDHHVSQPRGGVGEPLHKDKRGLNHLQEGRMNLKRLDDQRKMNRGVFSYTLPSIGNCSIFSNTPSKSIFLKELVTPSSFSLGNEAASNHSSLQPLRLWSTECSSCFPC